MGKSQILTLDGAVVKDPAIAAWMQDHSGEPGSWKAPASSCAM
jgi:hypothetical protein